MDKPLDLTTTNSLGGYGAELYFVEVGKNERQLLGQFEIVLVDFAIDNKPRSYFQLINGELNLNLFRAIDQTDIVLNNPSYVFIIQFTGERLETIPMIGITYTGYETVMTRHDLVLTDCLLEPLSPSLNLARGTVSIHYWNGTAQNIFEVE